MDKLLERSFAGERHDDEENVPNSDSIEELNSPPLRRPESVRRTGSAALNDMLQLHGRLDPRDHQNEISSAPTEEAMHDS